LPKQQACGHPADRALQVCGHHARRSPAETASVCMANMLTQHLLNRQVMGMTYLCGFFCRLPTYGSDQSTTMVSAPRCEVRFQCGGTLPSAASTCKHWRRKTAALALETFTHSARETYSCLLYLRSWYLPSVRLPCASAQPSMPTSVHLSVPVSFQPSVRSGVRLSVRHHGNTSAGLSACC
jgi:hypothetical protein